VTPSCDTAAACGAQVVYSTDSAIYNSSFNPQPKVLSGHAVGEAGKHRRRGCAPDVPTFARGPRLRRQLSVARLPPKAAAQAMSLPAPT
jgi:hypothetical protein